jgi:hypothetical protein
MRSRGAKQKKVYCVRKKKYDTFLLENEWHFQMNGCCFFPPPKSSSKRAVYYYYTLNLPAKRQAREREREKGDEAKRINTKWINHKQQPAALATSIEVLGSRSLRKIKCCFFSSK